MSGLPLPATPLVGREPDVLAVHDLLSRPETRLLTILGPAGMGKTRLAIEVASRTESEFPDGAYFVDLAPVEDPDRLLEAIAGAVGVEEGPAEPLPAQLKRFLSTRSALLVLDNFEQIIKAAPSLAELLTASPASKFMVTTRAPLQLSWEYRYPLQGLALPVTDGGVDTNELRQVAAVALFVQRARALLPAFALTEANAVAVTEICRRLDGLPLALELAAAQADVQSPQAILEGLKTAGLDLLSTGARDLPERHQTLRAAIAWSERLLEPEEQEAFKRLAVFVGSFTADAAAIVCGDSSALIDSRRTLASLVRKNLLHFEPEAGEAGRYRMLEMVREYALEQLREAELEVGSRLRHLEWCLALATAAEPELRGRHQNRWMDRLESDHDNLRAALSWCQRTHRIEEGLRIVAGVGWFWHVRGYLFESSQWLSFFLEASQGTRSPARMRALSVGSWLAHLMGRRDLRAAYAQEALTMAQQLGDRSFESWALQMLARGSGLGAKIQETRTLMEQSLLAAQEAEDEACLRYTYHFLSLVCQAEHKLKEAADYGLRAEMLHREAGDPYYLLWTLINLGSDALRVGDHTTAEARYRESLTLARDSESRSSIERCFLMMAQLAGAKGQYEQAARLMGVSEGLKERVGSRLGGGNMNIGGLDVARKALGKESFEALKARGRVMKLKDALAYALSTEDRTQDNSLSIELLTPRESEIASLIARGLTDRQIADELVISTRTAERHVGNILGKLGLATRTQIATWALHHAPLHNR